jgi:hypothetical protein
VASPESIIDDEYSLMWPRDWEGFLLRMQAVNELEGQVSTHPLDDGHLMIRFELRQDYEILRACVALGSPPAF